MVVDWWAAVVGDCGRASLEIADVLPQIPWIAGVASVLAWCVGCFGVGACIC